MMKYILTLAIFFLFSSSVLFAQSKKDIRTYGIKSVTETTVKYKNGEEDKRYKSKYTAFDRNGETIEKISYKSDGTMESREVYAYEGGELVLEIEDYPFGKGNDKPSYKHKTESYKKGLKVNEQKFDREGNLEEYEIFEYNKMGDRIREMVYNKNGELKEIIEYVYDNKGLVTEEITMDENRIISKKEFYEYEF